MSAPPGSGRSAPWTAFADTLRGFVGRRVPAGVDPDDVVQEVFLRAVRHMDRLRDADRIEAWLYQIARNAIADALRARHRRDSRMTPLDADVPEPDPEDPGTAEAELAPCLTPMIARLAEPYRSAIELTTTAGLTQTEAARRLGLSISGMKSRVQRGRAQLKRLLLECCDVEIDRRGAVSSYQPRGACAPAAGQPPAPPLRPCAGTGVSNHEGRKRVPPHPGRRHDMPANHQNPTSNAAQARAAAETCCGGPAPSGTGACCMQDAEAKATGGTAADAGRRQRRRAPPAAGDERAGGGKHTVLDEKKVVRRRSRLATGGYVMARTLAGRMGWIVAAVLAAVLVTWAAQAILPSGPSAEPAPREVSPRGPLTPGEQATIDLFEGARPSVVFITTRARVVDLWTRNTFDVPRGTGSGFIWDAQGHVVTNNHVIAGASGGANVRLSDGRDVRASVVGVSPAHDLAVLRIQVSDSPAALPIGSSADLRVGQAAYAIGNPFGLDWTLTTGIISALDRSLPSEDGRSLIEHLIQTDAAINPGNSGGPLLDSAGRLIGVNTLIFSPSGGSAGVGFAVPVDTVNRVVPQLIGTGKYVRPALGIQADDALNRVLTQRTGVTGVVVLGVTPGGGAEAAGLRGVERTADGGVALGDVIVAVEGSPIDSVPRLLSRLDDFRVGDTVRLTVLRNGDRREVEVRLQAGS